MKLNIYDQGKVEKTYESDSGDIPFGVVEDIVEKLDIEKLAGGATESRLELGKAALAAVPAVKPLLVSVFPGLTAEEIRKAKTSEILNVVIEVAQHVFGEISTIGNSEGN